MEGADPEEQMLLTRSSHKLVAKTLNIPELGVEVERAVYQVEAALAQKKALEEERLQMEIHRKEQEQQRK